MELDLLGLEWTTSLFRVRTLDRLSALNSDMDTRTSSPLSGRSPLIARIFSVQRSYIWWCESRGKHGPLRKPRGAGSTNGGRQSSPSVNSRSTRLEAAESRVRFSNFRRTLGAIPTLRLNQQALSERSWWRQRHRTFTSTQLTNSNTKSPLLPQLRESFTELWRPGCCFISDNVNRFRPAKFLRNCLSP